MGRIIFFAAACRRRLRHLARPLIPVLYRGQARFCPVCEKNSGRFPAFRGRPDARCPRCGALERHRLVWLFFLKKTDLLSGAPRRLLHVAPEPCLESKLKKILGKGYLSADLQRPRAMVKMDVTAIPFPDETFDAIYCSHVLEHVADDRKAMREFFRVLKRGAWAVLLVPISAPKTLEDPTITKPGDRRKAFGQEDHVRRYGLDYVDRLHEAGFAVEITRAADMAGSDEIERMGLTAASGEIYRCFRP